LERPYFFSFSAFLSQLKKFPNYLGLWEAKENLSAKIKANILYVAFARLGRESYKRRQKLMKVES
jgi:hypothetical protein